MRVVVRRRADRRRDMVDSAPAPCWPVPKGEPVGSTLTSQRDYPGGFTALGIIGSAATVLAGTLSLARGARLTDILAVAAASALVAALAAGTGGDQVLALLLAPLCCARPPGC